MMHPLISLISLPGVALALRVPFSKPQNVFLTPWEVQDIFGFDHIDIELEIDAFRYSETDEKLNIQTLDTELSNLTSYLSIRDDQYETTAPTGTFWLGMAGTQWDDWHKDVVVKAWRNALEIAQLAATSLTALTPGSPAYTDFEAKTKPNCETLQKDPNTLTASGRKEYMRCYRIFLAANNLAYGQYFAADPENIELIAANFQTVATQTNNVGAAGRGGLDLYLTWGPTITDKYLTGNQCNGATQAMVIGASRVDQLAGVLPDNAWVLHFCPPFFDTTQLGRMETQVEGTSFSLDQLDSTTRCILHEFTHTSLPWTLNTNPNGLPRDIRGYYTIVSYSADVNGQQQQPLTKKFSSKNADNYAWMAIYNYFNSLDKCAGVHYSGPNSIPDTCNTDVWPESQPKFIKTTWSSWPGSE